jgi:uncharacterized protein (UPF0212 family)
MVFYARTIHEYSMTAVSESENKFMPINVCYVSACADVDECPLCETTSTALFISNMYSIIGHIVIRFVGHSTD